MSNLVVPATKEQQLLQAKADALVFCKGITELKVTDEQSQQQAETALKAIKVGRDDIESLRTEIVGPHNAFVKHINARCKDIASAFEPADRHLRTELRARQTALASKREAEARKIEQERQASLEALRVEREVFEAKKDGAAELLAFFGCDEAAEVERAAVLKQVEHDQKMAEIELQADVKQKAAEAANSVAGARKIWKFEVDDIDKVPRCYLVVDEAAIRNHGRKTDHQDPIPGVRFYQETVIAAGRS